MFSNRPKGGLTVNAEIVATAKRLAACKAYTIFPGVTSTGPYVFTLMVQVRLMRCHIAQDCLGGDGPVLMGLVRFRPCQ